MTRSFKILGSTLVLTAALLASGLLPKAPVRASEAALSTAALRPSNFLWGVALSDYQNNGASRSQDWYQFDASGKLPDRVGQGPDFRTYLDEDLDRAKSLGLNAFRTSLEWARLEPSPGRFDPAEVAYVHQLLAGIRKRGMTPIITLNHFTMPAWTSVDDGTGKVGWESPTTVEAYGRYVAFVLREFGREIDWYLTFNEPSSFLLGGYLSGLLPPHRMGPVSAVLATQNVLKAHEVAYALIHKANPKAMVGMSDYNCQLPIGPGVTYAPGAFLNGFLNTTTGPDGQPRISTLDFIALHYYGRNRAPVSFPTQPYDWDSNPDHFSEVLKLYHEQFRLPILVAENGFATKNDEPRADGWTREQFLVAHVQQVEKARREGIPILGYLYWSLTDSYEWGSYDPRFGLWRVDVREGDLTRHETPSVAVYRHIVTHGGVTPELSNRYKWKNP